MIFSASLKKKEHAAAMSDGDESSPSMKDFPLNSSCPKSFQVTLASTKVHNLQSLVSLTKKFSSHQATHQWCLKSLV